MSKIKILIIAGIVVVGLIVTSIFIKMEDARLYIYTGNKINSKMVYEIKALPITSCDTSKTYSVLYKDDHVMYTTDELTYKTGCFGSYYISHKGQMYSFELALENNLISLQDLEEFEFGVEIETRDYLDNISVLAMYNDNNNLPKDYYYFREGEEEFMQAVDIIESLGFLYEGYDNNANLLFTINVTIDGSITRLEYYEDFILNTRSQSVASLEEHSYEELLEIFNRQ